MIVKKSDITAFLKEKFGLDKVRVDRDLDITGKGRAYRQNGAFVPAIYAWSHSPLDATNVGSTNAQAMFRGVLDALLLQEGATPGFDYRDSASVIFNEGAKGQVQVVLRLSRFPSYSPGRRMDMGYTSSYVTVTYA